LLLGEAKLLARLVSTSLAKLSASQRLHGDRFRGGDQEAASPRDSTGQLVNLFRAMCASMWVAA
jgi:hypothetical protein